jgi:hypothetical protein
MRVLLAGLFAAAIAAGQGTIFHQPGTAPTPAAPSGSVLAISGGGTGAASAAAARANLGAMYFAASYSGAATYNQGDMVAYNGAIFVSLYGSNTGREPDLNPTWWAATGTSSGAVASVFGRAGAVAAQAGDYASFYPSLAGSYSNPAWVASLAWGKLSGTPSFATVATSGSYADLSNKPTIPSLAAGGDLSGNLSSATVVQIQGKPVAATAPADGQTMRWSASAGAWQPAQTRYTASFTSQTSITVTGATHKLGTADLTVTCYSADTPPNIIEPSAWASNATTFDVTISFAASHSGRCVLR